jgi:hypothetical protein
MSAEKESGKSRALEVTELLVPEPLLSVNISPAALVRKVAAGGATILYDEIDGLFGNAAREEGNVDVRSILNAGYRRGAKVYRCVGQGTNMEVTELPAFAPVALAGLRHLPDTLASRTILIRMKKRKINEAVEQFRLRKVKPEADRLQLLIAKWCLSIAFIVRDAEPEMPDGIVDRTAECWEPLLALADAAGGGWPEKGRKAALHLSARGKDESLSEGVELLQHCQDAFEDRRWMTTAILLESLWNRDESPWREYQRGKPLSDRMLARMLREYDIRSKDIRTDTGTRKGYYATDFRDAWERHLGPSTPSATSATSATKLINKNKSVADVADVADRIGENGHSGKTNGAAAESLPPASSWLNKQPHVALLSSDDPLDALED